MRAIILSLTILFCFWGIAFFCYQEVYSQSQEEYQKKMAVTIEHGKGINKIGFLRASQGVDREPIGPESFYADSRGYTYICDGVNQMIRVFASDGSYHLGVNLANGMVASDINVDETGNMYVYDDVQAQLSQYENSGNFLKTIPVDISRWQSRGPMHIVKDTIYMSTSDQEDVPIGQIINGVLESPIQELLSKPITKGIHGQSGRKYFVKKTGQDEGQIEVIDETDKTMLTFIVVVKNLASILFLQEDDQGNIYIQTERFLPPNKIFLDVHKFSAQGKFVGHIPIPENNYGAWSVKLLDISKKGNIHQFLPTQERSYLNIFQRSQ